jgi:hypothetical protein
MPQALKFGFGQSVLRKEDNPLLRASDIMLRI